MVNGDSELIRDFVNTRDVLEDVDVLATPAALAAWCASHELVPGPSPATAGDLRQALELREALRQLLLGNNGIEIDPPPRSRFSIASPAVRVSAFAVARRRSHSFRPPRGSRARSEASLRVSTTRWPTGRGRG